MKPPTARRRVGAAGIVAGLLLAVAAVVLGVWRPWIPAPATTPIM
ncbi:hypothetical protein [Microbacterium sp. BF1]|nr:hypothetical protein [Microbacterium sp. BF1]